MKLINIAEKSAYTQSYTGVKSIDGVKFFPIRNFVGDEGDFCEVIRLDEKGFVEGVEGFQLRQQNRARSFPGSIKAWHFHHQQDEMWYVPPHCQMFVGLWDLRDDSPTKNVRMRSNLGAGNSRLLYIPRGVAHGYANFSGNSVDLFYFANNQFSLENPDENRVSWDFDEESRQFWTPERD